MFVVCSNFQHKLAMGGVHQRLHRPAAGAQASEPRARGHAEAMVQMMLLLLSPACSLPHAHCCCREMARHPRPYM